MTDNSNISLSRQKSVTVFMDRNENKKY